MEIVGRTFDEERALYGIKNASVVNCRFDGPADGESALKETSKINVENCFFNLRYPLWHTTDAKISMCEMTQNCRAALWYDKNIEIKDSVLDTKDAFWHGKNITVKDSVIDGVKNVYSGVIKAAGIKDLLMEDSVVNKSKTKFILG